MGLIDRTDLLSGCGGSQGAEQQAGARESVGLSAIATFVTAPLDEHAGLGVFFSLSLPLTGYKSQLSTHLSYRRIKCGHFKGLPHPKVPGGLVFSPCLKWRGPIHHRLFVTNEKNPQTTKSICARVTFARVSMDCIICSHACARACVGCTCTSVCDLYMSDAQRR